MDTTTDTKQALRDYIETLGVTYTATFQPTPQPIDTVKYPQLHWLITLSKGRQSMQVPYSQGSGHVKGYEKMPVKTPYDRRLKEECIRRTCETGKIYKKFSASAASFITQQTIPAPDLLDVLYCLVADSDVLNSSSYEEWGPALGYDIDSRKGESVYRQCLTQSLALKNLIGYAALETLRGLFQDY